MKNSASGPKKTVSPTPVCLQVGLGLLGDRARVALVELAGARARGRRRTRPASVCAKNGSIVRRCRVRHQRHVGGSRCAFQPAIEEPSNIAVGEDVFVDARHVAGDVLHLALA